MSYTTLITGGVGSGKTHHALGLAAPALRKAYIATAPTNLDPEMDRKIRVHQGERDASYTTIEEQLQLADAYQRALELPCDTILIDCLTLWASNLVFTATAENEPLDEFLALLGTSTRRTIIVTNEVSLGVIPADPMTRRYCSLLARINRCVAALADEVLLLVSGIAVPVKAQR
ncbi:bifunctional adenosylcobinamide kinase/adenosylcobinamide-phosphate guanylyltransferase [Pelovirga terrestris]|uniref:Adenosylcobinamide kinase n=1 Tax=Pelovirga terrestris TaxID=2771352 RepID=A0A8J6QQB4_9BACT|nr:bifunctional adenosylcobinamide kinase/adenosylcobinamide-phosphate guanylyltransferase [Pelovirga terrestris]MBD1399835.1 bifunctional adenosylcobinamide kinase/adenosylcobinamide-phosphate guanylyltransferase [Pelovirga terrestris]